ncbi:hypothetical protein CUZ56_01788 [Saezia sanguinis]|uniref:Uncharacterized protein n=1 Tax=Saezia sanguinis TaxID=1965230 RepID=A0A433SCN2_9BURK|nr:hypothetical protein CUZ56_01788 [Saezia sanguinis]
MALSTMGTASNSDFAVPDRTVFFMRCQRIAHASLDSGLGSSGNKNFLHCQRPQP